MIVVWAQAFPRFQCMLSQRYIIVDQIWTTLYWLRQQDEEVRPVRSVQKFQFAHRPCRMVTADEAGPVTYAKIASAAVAHRPGNFWLQGLYHSVAYDMYYNIMFVHCLKGIIRKAVDVERRSYGGMWLRFSIFVFTDFGSRGPSLPYSGYSQP